MPYAIPVYDLFDADVRRFGGRLSDSEFAGLPPPIRNLITLSRAMAKQIIDAQKMAVVVHFDYIDSEAFNALAMRSSTRNDLYYVGINLGVVPHLYDLFGRAMSHPDILPHVGNASKEVPGDCSRPFTRSPLDENRDRHCAFFFTDAIIFLLFHELTHIVRGHLGFLQNRGASALYAEHDAARVDRIPARVCQALEIDADLYGATKGALIRLKETYSGRWRHEITGLLDSPFDNPAGYIEMWGFSVGLFFRYLESLHPAFVAPESRTHPHPTIRECTVADAARREFEQSMSAEDGKIAHEAITTGFAWAEHAAKILGLEIYPVDLEAELAESRKAAKMFDSELFRHLVRGMPD
jgi:hypothetical protein